MGGMIRVGRAIAVLNRLKTIESVFFFFFFVFCFCFVFFVFFFFFCMCVFLAFKGSLFLECIYLLVLSDVWRPYNVSRRISTNAK